MAVRYATAVFLHGSFRVGEWLVEPSLNQLSRGDTTIQLELKVMDVLVCLAERAGEIVTRREIVDRVWATECIADNTLTKAITEIRNALGDDARNPSHIETVHRRGYRLIAAVDSADHHDSVGSMIARHAFPGGIDRSRIERGPYPGLAVFSEDEAEFFFGRETETAQLWRKLTSRRLLALIGPSGVGKSSLIRAGVIPARPEGWGVAVCHPGERPFVALARALVPEFDGDRDAISSLIHPQENGEMVATVSRWRDRHGQVLLVVDQFEELFTHSAEETQERFALLLRRLADEADVHILLVLRDDFLCRCHTHATLRPVFSDLTVLGQPDPDALRRAIVEPAKRLSFAFVDTDMAKEMVAEVGGERGALPMLAFAAARLWERRDRGRKLLTRTAYEDIGGVSGALARHAEDTLTAIGEEHLPIVREIFRNLVTAAGTRAVRELDDLLSVFPEPKREDARDVLRRLVDARLLTSFEDDAISGSERFQRVELVHESLLTSWPRLVRWQTQDVDAAELRDQLRHAALRWDEHARTNDCLWQGQVYREFVVWRESYPGGLTELEEAFAAAMGSFANRKKRRLRLLGAAALLVTAMLAAVFGTLWRQSVHETRRADAQKLLALGSVELQTDPTAALAWGRASLMTSDTLEGRLFALEALAKGPMARYLQLPPGSGVVHRAVFSPGGEWLALPGWEKLKICQRTGGPAVHVDDFPTSGWSAIWPFFDDSGSRLCAYQDGEIRTYTFPELSAIAQNRFGQTSWAPVQTDRGLMVTSLVDEGEEARLWRFDAPSEVLATVPAFTAADFDAGGEWVFYAPANEDRSLYKRSMVDSSLLPRLVHRHEEPISELLLDPQLKWVAIRGRDTDRITVWSLDGQGTEPLRSFDATGLPRIAVDRRGGRIVVAGIRSGTAMAHVFDLGLPAGADPLVLRSRLTSVRLTGITIDPENRWVVAGMDNLAAFWPVPENPGVVFPGDRATVIRLEFTRDGQTLAIRSAGSDGLRLQPVGDNSEQPRVLGELRVANFDLDPQGRLAVFSEQFSPVVWVYPFDGTDAVRLEGFDSSAVVWPVAYDPERHLVAAGAYRGPADQKVIRVWNLRDGSYQTFGPTEDAGDGSDGGFSTLDFLPDGSLLSSGTSGVRRWWPETRSSTLLVSCCWLMALAPNGRTAFLTCGQDEGNGHPLILDVDTAEVLPLDDFRGDVVSAAYSAAGDILAVGMADGTVHMRGSSGGDVHILYGHEAQVRALAFSPDGRKIASADRTGRIRVRAVPDLSRWPLHTLPHDELIAKLDTFTNLRSVRDNGSASGWTLEVGPFPGWETVPER